MFLLSATPAFHLAAHAVAPAHMRMVSPVMQPSSV